MIKVIKERHYKAGYVIKTREFSGEDAYGSDKPFKVTSAWTPNGDYIGDSKMAYSLVVIRGIKPEKASSEHNVCSIGFSEKYQRWYGWSHRAICGFAISDIVEDGDCAASEGWTEEYLQNHPEERTALPVGFTAKTLEDAKKMAVAFAHSVS